MMAQPIPNRRFRHREAGWRQEARGEPVACVAG